VFESPEFASVFATESDETWVHAGRQSSEDNWTYDLNKQHSRIDVKGGKKR